MDNKTIDFDSKGLFFPVNGFDPLQELLAGTFYTTIDREHASASLKMLSNFGIEVSDAIQKR